MKHALTLLSIVVLLNGCKVINVPVETVTGRPLFGEKYSGIAYGKGSVKRWREAGVTGKFIHSVRSSAAPMRAEDIGAIHKSRPVEGRWK